MDLHRYSSEGEDDEMVFEPSKAKSLDAERDFCEYPATTQAEIIEENNKKKKRRVSEVLRFGLFQSKKKKKKSVSASTGTPDEKEEKNDNEAATTQHRSYQRRISRLDMNEPIEDVFSGVEFATIDKASVSEETYDSDIFDDSDYVEDPDVVFMESLKEMQNIDANAPVHYEEHPQNANSTQTFDYTTNYPQHNISNKNASRAVDSLTS